MLFQNGAALCRLVMILTALALCILAGRAASPLMEQSWHRTHPGRGWRTAAACGAFIFLPVAGAITLSYAAELAVLRFDGSTLLYESFQMLAFSTAAGTALMIWALLWPGFAGIFIGLFLGLFLSIQLKGFHVLSFEPGLTGWPHPALIACSFIIPALWGLLGGKDLRLTWRRAITGIVMGCSAVAVAGALPLLQRTITRAQLSGGPGNDSPDNLEWFAMADSAINEFPRGAPSHRMLSLVMKDHQDLLNSVSLTAVSWRADANKSWSPWQSVSGRLSRPSINPYGHWNIVWSDQGASSFLPSFKKGEVRFQVVLTRQQHKSQTVPGISGAFAKDTGWTFEVRRNGRAYDWSTENRPFAEFQTVLRAAAFTDDGMAPHSQHSTALEFLHPSWFVETFSFTRLRTQRVELPEGPLTLEYLSANTPASGTIYITGVESASAPASKGIPPPDASGPGPFANRKRSPDLFPWPANDPAPAAEASEAEVSLWLQNNAHSLSAGKGNGLKDQSVRHRIRALVEHCPGLFIEWTVKES
ncbi:MAG TPA: hypothetical protein VHM91_06715, partial [Verrucomicrobiales bacterium]|nr:hypothetical protein [Verrucomicrobiales bacterium]